MRRRARADRGGTATSRVVRLALASAVGAALAAALLPSPCARAGAGQAAYSPRSRVYGRTLAEWTAEWWQWAFSIPRTVNPLTDDSGARVVVGQRGDVWFLGGYVDDTGQGRSVVTRTATIPSGKALLVAVQPAEWDSARGVVHETSEAGMRRRAADVAAAVDKASLHVTLDGVEVRSARVRSATFAFAVPDDNLLDAVGTPSPAGIYRPAASDGYWVMLKPPAIGAHTLRIQGRRGPPDAFDVDTTYQLTVVDHDRP